MSVELAGCGCQGEQLVVPRELTLWNLRVWLRLPERGVAFVQRLIAALTQLRETGKTRKGSMITCHDVARYILEKRGAMTAMKLQKLLYYSQAWSLVWEEAPLFPEKIEAWANGPVIREVYDRHRGMFVVEKWTCGDSANLIGLQRDTVDVVLQYYGDKPGQWLSDLTHAEEPWKAARKGLPDGTRGDSEITIASMAEYYGGL